MTSKTTVTQDQSKPILYSSSSSSRRHFHLWTKKKEEGHDHQSGIKSSPARHDKKEEFWKQRIRVVSVLKLLTALSLNSGRAGGRSGKVTGTLFGCRRGHVHLAFQDAGPKSPPSLLIELATPTAALIREMSTGLVRIALECDKRKSSSSSAAAAAGQAGKLAEEPVWRTYCNGKRSGYAVRRGCGAAEWRVLRAVEPVTVGAGVLPGSVTGGQGELMYMRAQFERVVGSRDSEAYYMLSPEDGHGGPELSIYLLRV